MPTLYDFLPWQAILQAVLALIAALMCWRGAHIGGDRHRRHVVAWGCGSVVTFVLAWLAAASAHHDADKSLHDANQKAGRSDERLAQIQSKLNDIGSQLHIAPAKSPEALTSKITAEINDLQSRATRTDVRIASLEHPPRSDYAIYDEDQESGDQKVGDVDTFSRSSDGSTISFPVISDAEQINFDHILIFRGRNLACSSRGAYSATLAMFPKQYTNAYQDVVCAVVS